MKKTLFFVLLATLSIFTSCKKSISDGDSASWSSGSAVYNADNPSISVNTTYGVTYTTLTFPTTGKAKLVLIFKGTSLGSYSLQSSSYYIDNQGDTYYTSLYSSTVTVSNYEVEDSNPIMSGTFTFKGYNSNSNIELKEGKFTRVRN